MKHTNLFLAANPIDTDRLALDREAYEIRDAMSYARSRSGLLLEASWTVQPLDLLRELRRLRPTIVHFAGHGRRASFRSHCSPGPSRHVALGEPVDPEGGGVCFREAGGAVTISTHALAELFGAESPSVRLAVLSACYTDHQAEALAQHVDCVVGMRSSVRHDAARTFALCLYWALAAGHPISRAFEQARAAVSLEGLDQRTVQLRARDGVDASQIVLG